MEDTVKIEDSLKTDNTRNLKIQIQNQAALRFEPFVWWILKTAIVFVWWHLKTAIVILYFIFSVIFNMAVRSLYYIYVSIIQKLQVLFIIYGTKKIRKTNQSQTISPKNDLQINSTEESTKKIKRTQTRLVIWQKVILEQWFEENFQHPYAKPYELGELSRKTMLEVKSIQSWLAVKRKKLSKEKNISFKYFSIEDKIKMEEFFHTKTMHPGPDDLDYLSRLLNKTNIKKIRQWFEKERFNMKNP